MRRGRAPVAGEAEPDLTGKFWKSTTAFKEDVVGGASGDGVFMNCREPQRRLRLFTG